MGKLASVLQPLLPPPPTAAATAKKKTGSSLSPLRSRRLWMRMDRSGQSELIECDKSVIITRARDLRIMGPIFCDSSRILAREKALIISFEFIRAVVTAEEILLLDPLRHEVLPFVEQLARQLPKHPSDELPFEFHVLEIGEFVSENSATGRVHLSRFQRSGTRERPALDLLATNITTRNLDRVRALKGDLTRLFGRVQKLRHEFEHLLDHNEDMAQLYLTAPSASADVDDLEMLLEAYLFQLDGTHNRIEAVREYIDGKEDCFNIELDNRRNELMQLQLIMMIAAFAIAIESLVVGIFGMNIPCSLYAVDGIFIWSGCWWYDGCMCAVVLSRVGIRQVDEASWVLKFISINCGI